MCELFQMKALCYDHIQFNGCAEPLNSQQSVSVYI